jgi:ATP-binding cassette subfamily F protein uup
MDLLIPPAPEIGNTAVELAGAGVRAGGTGRWLFRNMNLSLRAGQCTGVVGRNGVGKTTLLRVCLGELEPSEGTATVGKRVVFNYIDQSRMQLEGKGTVMDEVSDSGEMVAFGNQTLTARAYLRRFLFDESRVKERVDKLSGGERARLLLAKVLRRGGNVIILDEPTNDLDLASLRMLEEALADFDGTVLVVSHDRYFLDRICDQIVAFEEGGVFVQPGNFSYYLEKKKERAKSAQSSLKAFSSSPQPLPKSAPKAKRLNYKEQQELDSMEDTILAAESTVREMESTLNDPAFFVSRAAEAPDLVKKLAATKSEVARLYERWEELAKRI